MSDELKILDQIRRGIEMNNNFQFKILEELGSIKEELKKHGNLNGNK